MTNKWKCENDNCDKEFAQSYFEPVYVTGKGAVCKECAEKGITFPVGQTS